MPLSRKLQVFVSSTYEDLKSERQAAVTAILEAGHIPAGMELFAAGDESQMTVIRRWIDESDAFLLILGDRYGSIERQSGKSYVHLEYEHAIQQHKPRFSMVVAGDELRRRRTARGGVADSSDIDKHDEFLQLVTGGEVVRFWQTVGDIRAGILSSLRDVESSPDIGGWMKAQPGRAAFWSRRELPRLEDELTGSSEVWVLWPAGTMALGNSDELLTKIRRAILCDPHAAIDEYASLLGCDVPTLAQDVRRVTKRLQEGGTEVRWFPHPPMGIVISDPKQSTSWARTELLFPHRTSFSRPGLRVECPEMARFVDDVVAFFEAMWRMAKKPTPPTKRPPIARRALRSSPPLKIPDSVLPERQAAHTPHTSREWEALEDRFALVAGEVDAVWSHYPASGSVEWQVNPRPQEGTARDVQRFMAEAKRAGETLSRWAHADRKFSYRSNDPVDEWLNCVAAMADPGNRISGSGHNERGAHESGFIDRVVDASKLTCARLAATSDSP
jgi:hypothetical protein